MRRIGLVLTLSLILAGPQAGETQTEKVYRIGVLEVVSESSNRTNVNAFQQGLKELGYVEGRNFVIEYRSADGQAERFPELARELVGLQVDIVVTRGTPAALAAKRATETIPIVMAVEWRSAQHRYCHESGASRGQHHRAQRSGDRNPR
jgi:putative ABC transport system substrate-binding protein